MDEINGLKTVRKLVWNDSLLNRGERIDAKQWWTKEKERKKEQAERTKETRLTSRVAKPAIIKKKNVKGRKKWTDRFDRSHWRGIAINFRRDVEELILVFDSSYLALSGDTEPSIGAFHRNSSIISTKIRSVAGCAVHYCRFKRCIKRLANGTAIERARIRCWTVIAVIARAKRKKRQGLLELS